MPSNPVDQSFLSFFPVPKFLKTPSFGLDISDRSLKFIELINTKSGFQIGRHGEHKLPEGIIESGKIKDPKWLAEVLSSLRREGLRSVRVMLPEEQVYLFKLRLEKSGLVNIRESLELVLEEHVPISAQDAVFDYELLKEDARGLELQVAASPKNVIESYLAVFKMAEISVQSFELEAEAIYRAVVKRGDLETYMIVDFGEKRTGIFIVSSGFVAFSSTLDVGGMMLVEMIAKNFKISLEEAEIMKKKYGLQRNAENRELFSVLLNSVSVLRDELVKHFLYWHTHKNEDGKNNPPIKKIILCGGDANLIGLAEYLAVSMKSQVELADVWTNILGPEDQVPEINFKQAISLTAALGLALGDYENNQL